MAMDITDILSDTDFCTDIIVIKKAFLIDDKGRLSSTEEEPITLNCVIVPSLPNKDTQSPHMEIIDGRINIYTTTKLVPVDTTGSGDFISWKGDIYRVMDVKDWSDFNWYLIYADRLDVGGLHE